MLTYPVDGIYFIRDEKDEKDKEDDKNDADEVQDDQDEEDYVIASASRSAFSRGVSAPTVCVSSVKQRGTRKSATIRATA